MDDDWEYFNQNYTNIITKLIPTDTKVEKRQPTEVSDEELIVERHISTITALIYLEVNGETIDVTKFKNKGGMIWCSEDAGRADTQDRTCEGTSEERAKKTIVVMDEASRKKKKKKPSKRRQVGFSNSVTMFMKMGEKNVALKIFGDGLLHMTGVKSDDDISLVKEFVFWVLNKKYEIKEQRFSMINCNIKLGYSIKCEILSEILRDLHLHASYDRSSYPGILVKLFWNENKDGICHCSEPCKLALKKQNCPVMSASVFSTGSINITCKKGNWIVLDELVNFIVKTIKSYKQDIISIK